MASGFVLRAFAILVAVGVDFAGALSERIAVGKRCRCVLQNRLDRVRIERRHPRAVRLDRGSVGIENQGGDTAHHGRRHTGPAQAFVGAGRAGRFVLPRRMLLVQRAAAVRVCNDPVPRSDDVRFRKAINP